MRKTKKATERRAKPAKGLDAVIFGATGMVGQSVLRECLLDGGISAVTAVSRSPMHLTHPKLRNLVHADFLDFSALAKQFKGTDVCFYCLGIASAGLSEEEYKKITCDYARAAAKTLLKINPKLTFIFISGAGADSSEQGRIMWARIKGKTENALFAMNIKSVYAIRPAFIQPLHGITSRTRLYRVLYRVFWPFMPFIKFLAPNSVTTTEDLGKVMLHLAREGAPQKLLESRDIVALAKRLKS